VLIESCIDFVLMSGAHVDFTILKRYCLKDSGVFQTLNTLHICVLCVRFEDFIVTAGMKFDSCLLNFILPCLYRV
jgi:hypothetical protein